jgi:Fic family protein
MIGTMLLEETPSRIEPCLLDEVGPEIVDLVASVSAASSNLGKRLHPRSAKSLADLVRVMNCYYSNLIEGHNTTRREIQQALQNRLEATEERRNLQIEARAHIRVQQDVDRLYAAGKLPEPASVAFILWLHRSFYQDAPDSMLIVQSDTRAIRMEPGIFRISHDHEISVGRRLPPAAGRVEAFMAYFERRYRFDTLGPGSRLMAMAAAHHRLNYIHPFLDGNGRVSRLMSHAMALSAGIGAHGLWSVSRGLARGLDSRSDYKRMMDYADSPRQGDLDGRGNLSRKALSDFTAWFLRICLDQITFMSNLFALDALMDRFKVYVARREFRLGAVHILEHVLQRGEMPRGEASRIAGPKERSARELLATLLLDGIVGSETPKGPVSLRFSTDAVEILFPNLFPQT